MLYYTLFLTKCKAKILNYLSCISLVLYMESVYNITAMDGEGGPGLDARPIGVFDSGFGGLTAVRALRALLPEEDIVFFADAGHAPYGGRPTEELRRFSVNNLNFLSGHGVKAILAACGTVSSVAPDLLEASHIPAIGVLKATAAALQRQPDTGPVGLIATEATIRSGRFAAALAATREVIPVACPLFAPLVEQGHTDRHDPELLAAVDAYLRPLRERGIRTLALGCTHYGLIEAALRDYLGEDVAILEASRCAAEQLCERLDRKEPSGKRGTLRCYTTGDPTVFAHYAPLFLGEALQQPVTSVPLTEREN